MDVFSLVIDRLAEALAEKLNGAGRSSGATSAASFSGRTVQRSASRRKGEKRTAALLDQTTAQLMGHIKSNPGQRIEEISAELGVSTQELKLPTQKLVAGRKVKTRGQRRGTRYFPA
jgi:hypothetical protein